MEETAKEARLQVAEEMSREAFADLNDHVKPELEAHSARLKALEAQLGVSAATASGGSGSAPVAASRALQPMSRIGAAETKSRAVPAGLARLLGLNEEPTHESDSDVEAEHDATTTAAPSAPSILDQMREVAEKAAQLDDRTKQLEAALQAATGNSHVSAVSSRSAPVGLFEVRLASSICPAKVLLVLILTRGGSW